MSIDDWKVTVPEGESNGLKIERFEIDATSAAIFNVNCHGRPVRKGTYTRLARGGTLWMSDTHAEIYDHVEPVNRAARYAHRGTKIRCLVMGLGIGVVVQQLLRMEHVEHVDVVEIDEDVIKLAGPHYEAMGGDRITIHHADAYEIKWPRNTRWHVIWHDIWPTISVDHLPDMARLARSYGRRCDWQGFWGKHEALAERRHLRSLYY